MLAIESLTLKNFGAFKGEQRINFPKAPGILVFYGENMRGKTTLLNAIRFALFGKVVGRGRRPVPFHALVNLEARAAGENEFEVQLELRYAGTHYRLTRTGVPKAMALDEQDEVEYTAQYYLERGGHILPPEEARRELGKILPEQISRFFLFDGELLQEYEDLLHQDTDTGEKISQAIERILGLPILTGSRQSAKEALERAERAVAKAAQNDKQTAEFGSELVRLNEEKAEYNSDILRQKEDLEELKAQQLEVEEGMRRNARMDSLMKDRDRIKGEIARLEDQKREAIEDLQKAMATGWSSLIHERLATLADQLRSRETDFQAVVTRSKVLNDLASGASDNCPTCMQEIGPKALEALKKQLVGHDAETGDISEELSNVRQRLHAINKQLKVSSPQILELLWQKYDGLEDQLYEQSIELDDVVSKITSDAESEIRDLIRKYESTVGEITALKGGIEATQDKLAENESYRQKLQLKLEKISGGGITDEQRRRDISRDLYDLFCESVDTYRNELRQCVEDDASEFFRQMTTEPDYAGLRINDTYGLTIMHKDGSPIPVRSAGAEHVVAMSLVAALQNNAPLRGPIFIDSPFGRLDAGHRQNVLKTLPEMADQVVLLVYEGEMPPENARETLKQRLIAEWKLVRKSARHTVLESQ
ncbi:AAA family ATPase [Poseidonocella sedimentorum]|uniref:DNA sulfur modification protein DndD n=1 Tax=Poseidonocella sedimentorum TaxID=871652 RepID=A0A1I6CMP1_9RHOB|nr:AAA family ATPase [Poseidonocella sedimentorum]SFQ94431.1 DNA sulfur modification protein DndD [Poseidonocella sedimentorum]